MIHNLDAALLLFVLFEGRIKYAHHHPLHNSISLDAAASIQIKEEFAFLASCNY